MPSTPDIEKFAQCADKEQNGRPPRIYLSLFVSFCIAVGLVTLVGTMFERLLIREGVPRLDLIVVANFLTGVVAGLLYIQSRLNEFARQRLTKQRLAKIAEMNHHIRNALQVVTFYARSADNSQALSTINDAIRRIEWTLQEVLPRGWDLPKELSHGPMGLTTARQLKRIRPNDIN
jgi:hypothetical protein